MALKKKRFPKTASHVSIAGPFQQARVLEGGEQFANGASEAEVLMLNCRIVAFRP